MDFERTRNRAFDLHEATSRLSVFDCLKSSCHHVDGGSDMRNMNDDAEFDCMNMGVFFPVPYEATGSNPEWGDYKAAQPRSSEKNAAGHARQTPCTRWAVGICYSKALMSVTLENRAFEEKARLDDNEKDSEACSRDQIASCPRESVPNPD